MRRRQLLREYETERRKQAAYMAENYKEIASDVLERPASLEDLSDAVLALTYKEAFGKTPHHKMKRETIIGRLNDLGNIRA